MTSRRALFLFAVLLCFALSPALSGAQSTPPAAPAGTGDSTEGANIAQEEIKPKLPEIKEELEEKEKNLEIHGSAVGFYQNGHSRVIDGQDIGESASFGIVGDLTVVYRPDFLPWSGAKLFVRVHAGEGKGADKQLGERLFGNLNTIADDSNQSNHDGPGPFRFLEAYYGQEFFDGKLIAVVGKSEPLAFVDNNDFANNEYTQFVGKPFVNNPVLDCEDQYGPIVALSYAPSESFSFTALLFSSGYPNGADDIQKSVYDHPFENPTVAAQFAWSPKFGELAGNYRIYFWNATYDHPEIDENGSEAGWGVGLSLDQQITQQIGLFARFSIENKDVYEVDRFWAAGVNFKGIIPTRDDDEIGLGIAGLVASSRLEDRGTELHTEAYYRFVVNKYFAVSPDFQYVLDPLGDNNNHSVVAGMLRCEFSF